MFLHLVIINNNLELIHKGHPHQGGGGSAKCGRYCQFLPVKGQNMRTQGEGGSKNGQMFRTSFIDGPLAPIILTEVMPIEQTMQNLYRYDLIEMRNNKSCFI